MARVLFTQLTAPTLALILALLPTAGCSDDGASPLDAALDASADLNVGSDLLRPPDDVCKAASFLQLGCTLIGDAGVPVDAAVFDAAASDAAGTDAAAKPDSGGGRSCWTVTGTTVGATNRFELPASGVGACGLGTTASGPDRFYKVYLGASSGLGTLEFKSDFKSVVYFLQDTCSGDCVLGYKGSTVKTTPPMAGDYILVVDGETAADKGSFSLYLHVPGG